MAEKIAYTVSSSEPVQAAVDKLTEELRKLGFGVLSVIDVQRVLKEKIDVDIGNYVILDVCSPKHAKRALDAHREVGVALPCKICVYSERGLTKVSLYRPTEALRPLGFDDLEPLAEEVELSLKAAVDAVSIKGESNAKRW
jgi:uncharacterized protein (DUF302 family)